MPDNDHSRDPFTGYEDVVDPATAAASAPTYEFVRAMEFWAMEKISRERAEDAIPHITTMAISALGFIALIYGLAYLAAPVPSRWMDVVWFLSVFVPPSALLGHLLHRSLYDLRRDRLLSYAEDAEAEETFLAIGRGDRPISMIHDAADLIRYHTLRSPVLWACVAMSTGMAALVFSYPLVPESWLPHTKVTISDAIVACVMIIIPAASVFSSTFSRLQIAQRVREEAGRVAYRRAVSAINADPPRPGSRFHGLRVIPGGAGGPANSGS